MVPMRARYVTQSLDNKAILGKMVKNNYIHLTVALKKQLDFIRLYPIGKF